MRSAYWNVEQTPGNARSWRECERPEPHFAVKQETADLTGFRKHAIRPGVITYEGGIGHVNVRIQADQVFPEVRCGLWVFISGCQYRVEEVVDV